MISIAWKNLFYDKFRFLISIAGVAFSVLLILVLLGLFRGWKEKIVSYVGSVPADVWILQQGAEDFFDTLSILPQDLGAEIGSVENVKSVDPLVGRLVAFEHRDEKVNLFILGYDTRSRIGGPSKVIRGNPIPAAGEVIIDRIFAKKQDVTIGDKLTILGRDFRVGGISEGGDFVFYQLAFMKLEESQELFNSGPVVNFYVVSLNDSLRTEETMQLLHENVKGIETTKKKDFIVINQKRINDTFVPILTVLVGLGFLVGLTIVGQIIYTSTVERSREYGILKAIGASNFYLYQTIFQQSFTIGLIGFVVGVLLSFFAAFLFVQYVPEFVTVFWPRDVILTFGLTLLMSTVSGYLPAHRIAGIDPAIVFKS